ncbi:hypothetical protein ONZ43_g650 [Nemania bipapillata]|uniref:Uncharacterized protein n=1 Tax=Nemania bipapillata TaxID=110536 RepID=A0ACC2J7K2_9PEZI|nr:hypothetical protein ONZ43_g650 [Nemania bipapillata]
MCGMHITGKIGYFEKLATHILLMSNLKDHGEVAMANGEDGQKIRLTARLPKILGHVVRIAPNELVFSTPQAITDIYSAAIKNHETWVKTSFTDFGTGDGGISWEQDPVKHRKVAKRISPVFSTKSIKAKEHVLQMYVDMFVKRMQEIGGSKEGIELPKASDLLHQRVIATNHKCPLKFLFVPPRILRTLPHVLGINSQEVQRRIDQRANTKHLDYFESLVPPDAPIPTGRELNHLEQIAAQLLVAGYDPVADQFYGLLFWLLKEPDVLATLVEEIRSNLLRYEDIVPDALVSLRYMHACIQESFRMMDTGPNGMPRVSPGAMVDGVYVPKGVECQMSFFAIIRNEKYFRDALSYRPQRWLSPDHPKYETKYSDDMLKAVVPFSTGPRACPGRESAWIQMRLFLAKVLWAFNLELVRGKDITFDRDFSVHTMWNKPSIWVRFIPVERE